MSPLTHFCPPLRFRNQVPTFAVRETDVSRHNGCSSGAPLKPSRDNSALRALSSLRGLRGAPAVPPLCRETSVSRTANVGTWLRKRNGGQNWVNSTLLPLERRPRILRVTLVALFGFSPHIDTAITRASSRTNILKALAGTNWGHQKKAILIGKKIGNSF